MVNRLPVLSSSRLHLRPLLPSDARAVAQFNVDNRDYHRRWEPHRPEAYFSVRHQRKMLRQIARDSAVFSYGLFPHHGAVEAGGRALRAERGRLLGIVTVSNIIRGAFQSCFLGYRLDRRFEGLGLMREGVAEVLDLVFTQLDLHRVEANVMPTNDRSTALLKRLGFEYEGRARRYLRICGVWEDHDHYVMLQDRWTSPEGASRS